jgi:hypothetical protein
MAWEGWLSWSGRRSEWKAADPEALEAQLGAVDVPLVGKVWPSLAAQASDIKPGALNQD